jgi:dTDP-4-dehydrorhamnose reductase
MRILVLGVTGMLGSAVMRFFSSDPHFEVSGASRSAASAVHLGLPPSCVLLSGLDAENTDSIIRIFAKVKPDVVINCVGLVKQLDAADDPLQAVPLNTLLPHRLAGLCGIAGARLVHVSTDCVFSGAKGGYLESDLPDATDVYGRTKLLGEVDYPNAITLRTSIIGHELSGNRSLVGWFLAQEGRTRGFTKAIFSGLPTIELARVMKDFVLPRADLRGLYHVAASPINKFDLLTLIAAAYKKNIKIDPSEDLVIDRSLNSSRFFEATGYAAAPWPDLIDQMQKFR